LSSNGAEDRGDGGEGEGERQTGAAEGGQRVVVVDLGWEAMKKTQVRCSDFLLAPHWLRLSCMPEAACHILVSPSSHPPPN